MCSPCFRTPCHTQQVELVAGAHLAACGVCGSSAGACGTQSTNDVNGNVSVQSTAWCRYVTLLTTATINSSTKCHNKRRTVLAVSIFVQAAGIVHQGAQSDRASKPLSTASAGFLLCMIDTGHAPHQGSGLLLTTNISGLTLEVGRSFGRCSPQAVIQSSVYAA